MSIDSVSTESLLSDLVWVRFETGPRELEDALEALAAASFAINPSLVHSLHDATTAIEFPLYRHQIEEVETLLRNAGFGPATGFLGLRPMLEEIGS